MTRSPMETLHILRQRAEEKSRFDEDASLETLTLDDAKQLFHELRVHQIELEMQNEELRRTQHELAVSKARYLELFDLAPVGYLTMSEQGIITEANISALTMLAVERNHLLCQPITRFIYRDDQDLYYLNRKKCNTEMVALEWELRMLYPDGSYFWAHIRATPAEHGELWVALLDINERKRNERVMTARLRISQFAFNHSLEELLTNLVDEAESLTDSQIGFVHFVAEDDAMLTLHTWSSNTLATMCTAETRGQHHPLANAGVWADCIRQKKPLIHNNYAALPNRKGLPPGHAAVQREIVVPIVRNDRIVAVLGVGNKRSDYTEFDVRTIQKLTSLAWDFIALKQTEIDLKLAHDELELRVEQRTSELVSAHEQMKKVSFDLLWAEERERERIAGELHDRVGQSLLLAKMKLDALLEKISSDEKRSSADNVASLLVTSIQDIRSLTFRMRPPILESSGIVVALEWLCSSMQSDYGLKVEFVSDGTPIQLTAEVRYSLYQVVRELLINVAKHAGVDNAQLSITTGNDGIVVQLMDHGVGFNPAAASLTHADNGYGLYNVQQRIEQMGGLFDVESAHGMGTTVTMTLQSANQ